MNVQVETVAGVRVITFNRPNKKNALTPDMYVDAAEAINSAARDQQCNIVVLKGAGKDFTAGNDIAEFNSMNDDTLSKTLSFMRALMNCPLPVVAEVKGNAIGIGTTLLLHCDFVVACTSSKFMMPFINLGLIPEYASSYILPKISGYLNAAKWLMLGAAFDVQEAYKGQLVSYICEPSDVEGGLNDICQQLMNKPRSALVQTKALLKHDLPSVTKHMELELEYFAKALQSAPAQEAFDAFLHKRPIDKNKFLQ